MDSLVDGIRVNSDANTVALEINGSRFAYNVALETTQAIVFKVGNIVSNALPTQILGVPPSPHSTHGLLLRPSTHSMLLSALSTQGLIQSPLSTQVVLLSRRISTQSVLLSPLSTQSPLPSTNFAVP